MLVLVESPRDEVGEHNLILLKVLLSWEFVDCEHQLVQSVYPFGFVLNTHLVFVPHLQILGLDAVHNFVENVLDLMLKHLIVLYVKDGLEIFQDRENIDFAVQIYVRAFGLLEVSYHGGQELKQFRFDDVPGIRNLPENLYVLRKELLQVQAVFSR